MSGFAIAAGYRPGLIGRVVWLHGHYYHAHWGFGQFFEAKVATDMAGFMDRFDEGRDGIWTALCGEDVEGAVAIDGENAQAQGAHLRWFIVSERLRGLGAGAALLDAALAFCREKNYPAVRLSTFRGLDVARHLYEKAGFCLIDERPGSQWGSEVFEQRFVCRLE